MDTGSLGRTGQDSDGELPFTCESSRMHELCLAMDEEPAESLWVRTGNWTNMVNIVVGVCYKPPNQEKEVEGTFFGQLEEDSCSQILVLMGDFNHPGICWNSHGVGYEQSRRSPDHHFTNDSEYSCLFLHPTTISGLLLSIYTPKKRHRHEGL